MLFGVEDVVASGTVLIAVGPFSFRVYDVADPTNPVEVGRHILIRVWPGTWLLDPEWPLPDFVRLGTPVRRSTVFDGVRLVVGDHQDVVAFDIMDGEVEGAPESLEVSGVVAGMILHAGLIYTADPTDRGGLVLTAAPGALAEAGVHDLESAVDNVVTQDARVFRRTPWGLEVASFE